MSFSNLEWYGWLMLCFAISSSAKTAGQIYAIGKVESDESIIALIPAAFITLTLWMMTP